MQNPYLSEFIARHRLPESYVMDAQQWFAPVAKKIAVESQKTENSLIVGINGSQGSGKSTLADYLALLLREEYRLNVAVLSIDDFYLTLKQRELLSKTVHPLMATRGVPGTHDISLCLEVIRDLKQATSRTRIPRFDKSVDDRYPADEWDTISPPTDIVIFEGWCVGAVPQTANELMHDVNELEKEEDPDGVWRKYVNRQLGEVYQELFNLLDIWIMLKAPSFDCVYQWRLEQEHKLRRSLSNQPSARESHKIMNDKEVKRFIQYYQRITEHLLNTLPEKTDILFELDENRKIFNARS